MQDWVVTGKWSIKESCSCSKWEVFLKMESLLCSAAFSWMNWWSCTQLAPQWQPLTHFMAHLGPAGLVQCNGCNGRTVFLVFNCRPLKDGCNVAIAQILASVPALNTRFLIFEMDLQRLQTADWSTREYAIEEWLNAKRYNFEVLVLYFSICYFIVLLHKLCTIYCATFRDDYGY